MRLAVTGTPGTGKTTATDLLDAPVVHLNDVIREAGLATGRDEHRGSLVTDLAAVREWLSDHAGPAAVVESHLAHHLDADRVAVLRCHPRELSDRLRERGEPETTVTENAESEALDVVLTEAVERHGLEAVYEIDATDRTPEAVAAALSAVLAGEREPSAGTVSFVDYL